MDKVALAALVRRVPGWQDRQIELTHLHGGITNTNYVAVIDGVSAVVRVPGERTELLGIDRANEAEAALRAAELGIAPAVLGKLPSIGTLITVLVPGRHLEPTPFTHRLPDVVRLLQTFHRSGPLRGAFPIHRVSSGTRATLPRTAWSHPCRTVGCTSRAGESSKHSLPPPCRLCRATTIYCLGTYCSRTPEIVCGCWILSTPA